MVGASLCRVLGLLPVPQRGDTSWQRELALPEAASSCKGTMLFSASQPFSAAMCRQTLLEVSTTGAGSVISWVVGLQLVGMQPGLCQMSQRFPQIASVDLRRWASHVLQGALWGVEGSGFQWGLGLGIVLMDSPCRPLS